MDIICAKCGKHFSSIEAAREHSRHYKETSKGGPIIGGKANGQVAKTLNVALKGVIHYCYLPHWRSLGTKCAFRLGKLVFIPVLFRTLATTM